MIDARTLGHLAALSAGALLLGGQALAQTPAPPTPAALAAAEAAAAPDAAAATSPAAAAAKSGTEALVDRVQAVYQETHDLTATFQQTYHFKITGRKKRSSGRVFLKLPGKMRWDYLEPERKHFIADGRTLWVVAPEDRQVLQQPLERSDISSVLGFLMGSGDLRENFDLRQLTDDEQGRHRLELKPKEAETHFRTAVLFVDPTTFRTVGTEIVDPAGNLNRLEFADIQANQGLPDSGFVFQVPPDFRIIETAGPRGRPSTPDSEDAP